MRLLKVLYAVFIAIAIVMFGVLYARGRIPYAAINLLPVIIAPAGYLYSRVFTAASILTSWLIVCPALILIARVDPVNALGPVIVFNLLMASYLWYKNISEHERASRYMAFNKSDGDKARLSDDLERAAAFESGIKVKEAEIVTLYEITKKMSEHLKFEEMFRAFSLFLKENFTFRRCDLFILDRADDAPHVNGAYSVWQKGPDSDEPADAARGEKYIRLFTNRFRDVWLTKKSDAKALEELSIKDGEIETLLVLPLMSERKMVGILSVENLVKYDLERFVILAMQFALEIKKVLLYEMVERLAVTDSLTGLYVRRYFYERFGEELQRSKSYKFEFAFIMVDIDDFKKCNDTYGHMVGDVVIKDIARIIKESVRDIDIVGRYGGEEFAIALPETGDESARQVAERLRRKVAESVFKAYDENVKLTISIGIAMYPRDASEVNDIIDKADGALYSAKKSGKDVVCVYKR